MYGLSPYRRAVFGEILRLMCPRKHFFTNRRYIMYDDHVGLGARMRTNFLLYWVLLFYK